MSIKEKILIIGCGNLGSVIAKGINLGYDSENIFLSDRDLGTLNRLRRETGFETVEDLRKTPHEISTIVLAVKPQDIKEPLAALSSSFDSGERLVISVAAGVRIDSIKRELFSSANKDSSVASFEIARVMPNLCSLVNQGVSGVFSNSDNSYAIIEKIFKPLGEVFRVSKEDLLDIVTALGGSGPAYVAEFLEALILGGVMMGLSREQSQLISLKLLDGVSSLIKDKKMTPQSIKEQVSSPAGTTITGLSVLENGAFKGLVMSALEKSAKRAKELS